MNILVVGRTGQLARALTERAPHKSAAIRCLGRPDIDLARPETLDRALRDMAPDIVINAAAYTAVDAAEAYEATATLFNAAAPGHLAHLAAARSVPLIHVSTDYVFDGTAARPYREDDPIAPASAYGRGKAAGEAAVHAAGGRALIVRTAWVYSPFGKNFVRTMLRLGATKPELRVVSDQRGNPTNALDLADALLDLAARAEDWPTRPDTLHAVSSTEATWHALAVASLCAAGLTTPVHAITTDAFPTPAQRPLNSCLDTAKLRERYALTLPAWQDSLPGVVARLRASDEDA